MQVSVQVLHKGSVIFKRYFTKFPITLGRNKNSDIPLTQYPWISRKHAQLDWSGNQLILNDMNSSNGLSIDGEERKSILIDGEHIIDICELQIIFSVQEVSLEDTKEDFSEMEELTQITGTTDLSRILESDTNSPEDDSAPSSVPEKEPLRLPKRGSIDSWRGSH